MSRSIISKSPPGFVTTATFIFAMIASRLENSRSSRCGATRTDAIVSGCLRFWRLFKKSAHRSLNAAVNGLRHFSHIWNEGADVDRQQIILQQFSDRPFQDGGLDQEHGDGVTLVAAGSAVLPRGVERDLCERSGTGLNTLRDLEQEIGDVVHSLGAIDRGPRQLGMSAQARIPQLYDLVAVFANERRYSFYRQGPVLVRPGGFILQHLYQLFYVRGFGDVIVHLVSDREQSAFKVR